MATPGCLTTIMFPLRSKRAYSSLLPMIVLFMHIVGTSAQRESQIRAALKLAKDGATKDQQLFTRSNIAQRHLRVVNCMTQSEYAIKCYSNLIFDSDNDGIISQDDFTDFLYRLTCVDVNELEGDLILPPCKDKTREKLTFEEVPPELQFRFKRAVCRHLTPNSRNKTIQCIENYSRNEPFGFLFDNTKSDIYSDLQTYCTRSFAAVVNADFIQESTENCQGKKKRMTVLNSEIAFLRLSQLLQQR